MSKKCTPLWCEAHLEVKSGKKGFGALLDVRMRFLRGRHKGFCTLPKVSKKSGFCISTSTTLHPTTLQLQLQLRLQLQLQLQLQPHYITLYYANCITLHYTTLNSTTRQAQLQLQLQLYYATPHYTNYTTLRCTLHYTPLHFTSLHYTQLHYSTLQLQLQLRYFTPDYTTLPYTTLHFIHYTTTNATASTLHKLHHATTTTPPHYYNYSCATPHYIQQLWVRRPTQ